jgi:hypothetical protein
MEWSSCSDVDKRRGAMAGQPLLDFEQQTGLFSPAVERALQEAFHGQSFSAAPSVSKRVDPKGTFDTWSVSSNGQGMFKKDLYCEAR